MFYGYEYTFNNLDELEIVTKNCIDYYNNERIIEKLKGLSPCSYRQQYLNQLVLNYILISITFGVKYTKLIFIFFTENKIFYNYTTLIYNNT